ncbi:tetratricopeptide repeat protein [Mycolicibacterium bacteremicum]|uniref:Co-chaperone YbbN n=1 Tax=Mycolicibacterium bacteremicum TaxID=564198 RepID=A0A1W9YYE6_MYCBA|nr:tetratricopeptide repeat protein [Mycolicibacterium bacteremicum]MCV7431238.1 tetratricopeptide repeat protein [Mycolicibacterium bacteremicum]ORA05017.1 co-chaperone YbbN [Mycolicibacterium bacteremicum]
MTRPRPTVGPALAGAFDLSALKAPPPGREGAATVPAGAVEVTEANLEAEVLARSGEIPVVVLLWTPRSDASVQLADTLAALVQEDGGTWSLATVNVDTTPRVAQMFGVQAVPTVVALAGGQPISSFQGPQPAEQLRQWIDSLISATAGKLSGVPEQGEQTDPALEQARAYLDDGDFDAALTAYQDILAAKPNDAEATGAIRQITFLQRATTRAPESPALADVAPGDVEAAFAAADVEILQQNVTAAFDRLIELIKRTAGDERTAARTRLIELFDLFDAADPEVIAGRRKLANALY